MHQIGIGCRKEKEKKKRLACLICVSNIVCINQTERKRKKMKIIKR